MGGSHNYFLLIENHKAIIEKNRSLMDSYAYATTCQDTTRIYENTPIHLYPIRIHFNSPLAFSNGHLAVSLRNIIAF